MQIYQILYKTKYNPKSSFKSYNLNLSDKPTNSNSQSAFRFYSSIKEHDKAHRQKAPQTKSKIKGIQHASITGNDLWRHRLNREKFNNANVTHIFLNKA